MQPKNLAKMIFKNHGVRQILLNSTALVRLPILLILHLV